MTFHADVPQHADLAARLAPIRAHFIGTLPPRRDRLTTFLAAAGSTSVQPAMMRQLQEDAHKIRGVAPTLGFLDLGAAAAEADELLEPWHDSDASFPLTNEIIDCLARFLKAVETTMLVA